MKHIELIKHFGKRAKKRKEYLEKINLNIPFLYNRKVLFSGNKEQKIKGIIKMPQKY